MKKSFQECASSLISSFPIKQISVTDLFFGFITLAQEHSNLDLEHLITHEDEDNFELSNSLWNLIKEDVNPLNRKRNDATCKFNPCSISPLLLRACNVALEYSDIPYELTKMENQRNVIHMCTSALHYKPVFISFVDHQKKHIVISVRGTKSIQDAFTDLSTNFVTINVRKEYKLETNAENFSNEEGDQNSINGRLVAKCHAGMYESAKWILQELSQDLINAIIAHPEYSILTCGHSLGAATSCVLALLLREWIMDSIQQKTLELKKLPPIYCINFACPAAFSKELSELCKQFCLSFCVGVDVVSRLSPGQVENLRIEIMNTQWKNKIANWYNSWNETSKPFDKLNNYLEKFKIPKIPTRMNQASDKTEIINELETYYPSGNIFLITYSKNEIPNQQKSSKKSETQTDIIPDNKMKTVTDNPKTFFIQPVKTNHFNRMIVHSNMFYDHYLNNYFEAFQFLSQMSFLYELRNNSSFREENLLVSVGDLFNINSDDTEEERAVKSQKLVVRLENEYKKLKNPSKYLYISAKIDTTK